MIAQESMYHMIRWYIE